MKSDFITVRLNMMRFAIIMAFVLFMAAGATIDKDQSEKKKLCPAHLQIFLHAKNQPGGFEIDTQDFFGSLKTALIDVNKEAKFFSWTPELQNSMFLNLSEIVDDYIYKLNVNFIVIKWNTNSNFTDESGKSEQMYDEAECLSRLLNILSKMGAHSLKFHLIAHDYKVTTFSLAAQMAYPVLIGRISALDPSRDKFSVHVRQPAENLKIPVIDVIYTSLLPTEIIPNYGHAIFFPNGGYHPQPGGAIWSSEISSIRSVEYWAESVHNVDTFWSLRCNNWKEFSVDKKCLKSRALSVMGEYVSPRARGFFYLTTNDRAPYSVGKSRPLLPAAADLNFDIADYN